MTHIKKVMNEYDIEDFSSVKLVMREICYCTNFYE